VSYRERARSWSISLCRARGRRPWWPWQRVCALGLCLTSTLLWGLATLCLATGLLHQGGHQHQQSSAEAAPASARPDLCACAQHALLTTVAPPVALLPSGLPPGDALPRPGARLLPTVAGSRPGIRAPPLV
jgi:hypothetical protein